MKKITVFTILVSIFLFACGGKDKRALKIFDPQQPIRIGGVEVWKLKVFNTGKAHITPGYYSPSNDPADPQHITTFIVTVK